jgi:ribonuclease HII
MAKQVSKKAAELVVEHKVKKVEAKVAKALDNKAVASVKPDAKKLVEKVSNGVLGWFKKGDTVQGKVEEVATVAKTTREKALEKIKTRKLGK